MKNDKLVLNFSEIDPYVRYANLLQCESGYINGPRVIYDHQFLYVHKGKGIIEINDVRYVAMPGDLFFYGPMEKHTIRADEEDPFLLTGIHFDFVRKYPKEILPITFIDESPINKEIATSRVCFNDFQGFPQYINLSGDPRVGNLIMEIVKEHTNKKINYDIYTKGIFSSLLSIVSRHVINRNEKLEGGERTFNELLAYLQKNYKENLNNKEIARQFHFHPNYLNQLMVANTGISLRQYVIDLRIKKAIALIMDTSMNLTEISDTVGFSDIHYFSRQFKKKTGCTPSQIRGNIIA